MKTEISAVIARTAQNRAEVDRIVAALLETGIAKGVLKRRDAEGEQIFILSEIEAPCIVEVRPAARANAA